VLQLSEHSALLPRQLRHGLSVLVQQNLVYHAKDQSFGPTTYEANADATYNLLRTGRIVSMVGSECGSAAQDIVQILMLLGHARIADLEREVCYRNCSNNRNQRTNGLSIPTSQEPGHIESIEHLHSVLTTLVSMEIVEQVGAWTFESPDEVYHRIEQDVMKTGPGERQSKNKVDLQTELVHRLREARDRSKGLKRKLRGAFNAVSKRRKLWNGRTSNDLDDEGDALVIDVGYLMPLPKGERKH
jgi:DNA-directed RNA polymerase III subunit RPC3